MTACEIVSTTLHTPCGEMIAIASHTSLFYLEFTDRQALAFRLERFKKKMNTVIIQGQTPPLLSIQLELMAYFAGKLKVFHTPISPLGTPFQIQVWQALKQIPFGETRSYLDIAQAIGRPTACRAVAQANRANPLVLIIPCHRVIQHNGDLGGYAGRAARKSWLLKHEIT